MLWFGLLQSLVSSHSLQWHIGAKTRSPWQYLLADKKKKLDLLSFSYLLAKNKFSQEVVPLPNFCDLSGNALLLVHMRNDHNNRQSCPVLKLKSSSLKLQLQLQPDLNISFPLDWQGFWSSNIFPFSLLSWINRTDTVGNNDVKACSWS